MTKKDFPNRYGDHLHSVPVGGGYYICLQPSAEGFTLTALRVLDEDPSNPQELIPEEFTKSKRKYRLVYTPRSERVWQEACEIAEMMLAQVVLTGGKGVW